MRTPFALLLALTAACTPTEQVDLEYRSTLNVQSRGVVVDDEGRTGAVGMGGPMACDFTTANGTLGGDYDYPEEVTVVDANTPEQGGIVPTFLAITPGQVHIHEPGGTFDFDMPTNEHFVPGVLDALLTEDGFVVLQDDPQDGCQVAWHRPAGPDAVEHVDDAFCGGAADLSIDRETNTVFVGSDDSVVSTTPDGTDDLGESGDLVVWDEHTDALYVSRVGGSDVSALESDGQVRWTVSLEGSVQALEALGTTHGAGVMLEQSDGSGLFVVVDGFTGEVTSEVETPAASKELVTNRNGGLVGMVLEWETHFYDLVVD